MTTPSRCFSRAASGVYLIREDEPATPLSPYVHIDGGDIATGDRLFEFVLADPRPLLEATLALFGRACDRCRLAARLAYANRSSDHPAHGRDAAGARGRAIGMTVVSNTLSLIVFAIRVSVYATGFSVRILGFRLIEITVFAPLILIGAARAGAYMLRKCRQRLRDRSRRMSGRLSRIGPAHDMGSQLAASCACRGSRRFRYEKYVSATVARRNRAQRCPCARRDDGESRPDPDRVVCLTRAWQTGHVPSHHAMGSGDQLRAE